MIIVTAKCILKDHKKEEFKIIAQKLIEETNKENGCISYDLYEDINDENIVSFIEQWTDKEALENHMNTEHFKTICPKLGELQIKDSIINVYKK